MNWHSSLWGEWENSECDIIAFLGPEFSYAVPAFPVPGRDERVALSLPVAHPNAMAGIPNS